MTYMLSRILFQSNTNKHQEKSHKITDEFVVHFAFTNSQETLTRLPSKAKAQMTSEQESNIFNLCVIRPS